MDTSRFDVEPDVARRGLALALRRLVDQYTALPDREQDLFVAYLNMGDDLHTGALHRLSDLIPWHPGEHAYAAMQARVREREGAQCGPRTYEAVRKEIVLTALYIAIHGRVNPRRWRIGQQYLKDDDDTLIKVSIHDLVWAEDNELTWDWIVGRVCYEAELIACERSRKETAAGLAMELLLSRVAREPSAEDEAVTALTALELSSEGRLLFELVAKRQRPLLELLFHQAAVDKVNVAEAARSLGMTPNAAYQSIDRLRRKVRAHSEKP